jgi:glycosyltransferase involved in cell wall biosynthesis
LKVLLIGNYLHDQQESMQRFAAFLATGLTKAGHEVRLCRPPAFLGRLRPSGDGVGKWLGYVDKFGVFPSLLREAIKWADVVHICDHANSFYLEHLRSVPHVVTCHDLLAVRSACGEIPQNRTGWTGRQLQQLILRSLSEAQHIACVSEATRRDLLRLVNISESRVSLAYNALNYPYSRMDTREAEGRVRSLLIDPSRSFFLHVGGNQWYKNRLGVLQVFSLLRGVAAARDAQLVMVGRPWTAEMRRFVIKHGMDDVTFELTGVSNEDLRALYSTATMMLFPSLQEGFGWPIVEAQACGCPVVTSGRSPMDEVGGEAAIYVDPDDPESAAVVVERSLELAPRMRDAGMLNAARFSESSMIESYVSLYDKVRDEAFTGHQLSPSTGGGSPVGIVGNRLERSGVVAGKHLGSSRY